MFEMFSGFAVILALAQAAADPPPVLFELSPCPGFPSGVLPVVDINAPLEGSENVRLLNEAGLPAASGYATPVVRYYEYSAAGGEREARHLLVQLAVTGDGKRVQVLVYEAIGGPYLFRSGPVRLAYGSADLFESLAPALLTAASRLRTDRSAGFASCDQRIGARMNVRLPGEAALERAAICSPDRQSPVVIAGTMIVATAEKVLGGKIEPAASFD